MKPLGVCCGREFYGRPEWAAHQRQHRQDKQGGIGPLNITTKEKHMNTSVKSQGDIMVVETDEATYLGFVEEVPAQSEDDVDLVKVRTGFRGHPFVLQKVDVDSITPATRHPYVEWA